MLTLDQVIFSRDEHMAWWYDVRNDESVRTVSRVKRKIKADEHRKWWQESAKLSTRKLYFLRWRQVQSQPPQIVGIARLDHRGTWTEVSIAVSQDWRGHGIATEALKMLAQEAARLRWPTLGAVINAQNSASLALFIKAGYTLKKKGFVQVAQHPTRRMP